MQIIKTIGNKQLLEREKTLFLCSKHTPIDFYLVTRYPIPTAIIPITILPNTYNVKSI